VFTNQLEAEKCGDQEEGRNRKRQTRIWQVVKKKNRDGGNKRDESDIHIKRAKNRGNKIK